jgi:hypothetical protein
MFGWVPRELRIWDCGLRIEPRVAARGPPAACRLGPARAGCTNKPNWLEPTAPNEPNSRQPGWPSGLDSAKQSQSGPAGPAPVDRLCETKPISTSLAETRRPNCAKQSQTWAAWDIWGMVACRRRGEMCQTNPIPGNRPKRGSAVQTKPIPRLRIGDGPAAGGPTVPNKPNSRQRGWPLGLDSAKQSQSGPAGPAPGADCAKRTQFPAARMAAGAGFCQTKPIWPGQSDSGCRLCQTKPIPRRGRLGGRSILRNKPNSARSVRPWQADCAKQSQTWEDWGRWAKKVMVCGPGSPESGMRQTNPIPGRRDTPPFHYPSFQTDANHAKRTQFPPRRRNEMPLFALFSPRQVVGCVGRFATLMPRGISSWGERPRSPEVAPASCP